MPAITSTTSMPQPAPSSGMTTRPAKGAATIRCPPSTTGGFTRATVWSGNAGAPIGWAPEIPFSGLAIGEGLLAVPASNRLVVFGGIGTPGTVTYTPPRAPPTTPFNGTDQAVAYQIDPAHSGAQPQDSLTTPLRQQWAIDFQ